MNRFNDYNKRNLIKQIESEGAAELKSQIMVNRILAASTVALIIVTALVVF